MRRDELSAKLDKLLRLVLCSKYRYDDVWSQRFDDTSIDTAGPASILWHVCSSGPSLIWIQEHCLKCLTTCLIWPQRNTTGLPDIKRRNPRNRATHSRNTDISAKCDTYFVNLATTCTRALTRAFWKHRLASSLAISTLLFIIRKVKFIIH